MSTVYQHRTTIPHMSYIKSAKEERAFLPTSKWNNAFVNKIPLKDKFPK
jgi:hypothetical protein